MFLGSLSFEVNGRGYKVTRRCGSGLVSVGSREVGRKKRGLLAGSRKLDDLEKQRVVSLVK